MSKDFKDERHEIFKDKLYHKALLSRLEFKAAIAVFKEENPDLITDERFDPGINSFKKFIRGNKW